MSRQNNFNEQLEKEEEDKKGNPNDDGLSSHYAGRDADFLELGAAISPISRGV